MDATHSLEFECISRVGAQLGLFHMAAAPQCVHSKSAERAPTAKNQAAISVGIAQPKHHMRFNGSHPNGPGDPGAHNGGLPYLKASGCKGISEGVIARSQGFLVLASFLGQTHASGAEPPCCHSEQQQQANDKKPREGRYRCVETAERPDS